jgi:transcriptional regulator with XRE-family HTH domain
MKIGTTIQKIRKGKKLRQEDFATSVGISSTALSQIETNNAIPKQSTLEKICNELGISVELLHLMSIDEKSIPEKNRDSYGKMFPEIHDMMIRIFSEPPTKVIEE